MRSARAQAARLVRSRVLHALLHPPVVDDAGLTPAEHGVIDLLAQAASLFRQEVLGVGTQRENDWAEFAAGIHQLQHTVMAQCAARMYPDLFRLLGSD